MTREEAMESAKDAAFKRNEAGYYTRIVECRNFFKVNNEDGSGPEFKFDLLRRIPPKGTPVMTTDKARVYFSYGEICNRCLRAGCNYDGRHFTVELENWIELQEVQND